MKPTLARLLTVALSIFSLGAVGNPLPLRSDSFFLTPESVEDSLPRRYVLQPKGWKDCDVTVTEGENYKIFEVADQRYILRFDDHGRLSQFDSPGGSAVVVYSGDAKIPHSLITPGRVYPLIRPGDSEMVAALRAQGKLPSPERIQHSLCKYHHAKAEVDDGMPSLIMSPYYWEEWADWEGMLWENAFWNSFGTPPLPKCADVIAKCKEENCDQGADYLQVECIGIGGVYGLALGIPAGVVVGTLCAGAVVAWKWEICRPRCEIPRVPCEW